MSGDGFPADWGGGCGWRGGVVFEPCGGCGGGGREVFADGEGTAFELDGEEVDGVFAGAAEGIEGELGGFCGEVIDADVGDGITGFEVVDDDGFFFGGWVWATPFDGGGDGAGAGWEIGDLEDDAVGAETAVPWLRGGEPLFRRGGMEGGGGEEEEQRQQTHGQRTGWEG